MLTKKHTFNPDYVVPPGWLLEERLETKGMSSTEFAHRCGQSPQLIEEIIAGKAPINPEIALHFERILSLESSIWLGIESDYQRHLQQEEEARSVFAASA